MQRLLVACALLAVPCFAKHPYMLTASGPATAPPAPLGDMVEGCCSAPSEMLSIQSNHDVKQLLRKPFEGMTNELSGYLISHPFCIIACLYKECGYNAFQNENCGGNCFMNMENGICLSCSLPPTSPSAVVLLNITLSTIDPYYQSFVVKYGNSYMEASDSNSDATAQPVTIMESGVLTASAPVQDWVNYTDTLAGNGFAEAFYPRPNKTLSGYVYTYEGWSQTSNNMMLTSKLKSCGKTSSNSWWWRRGF
jgi:hypothetical protein